MKKNCLTKIHYLPFQKWPKINFWTGKKFKTAKNAISRNFHGKYSKIFFHENDLFHFTSFLVWTFFCPMWNVNKHLPWILVRVATLPLGGTMLVRPSSLCIFMAGSPSVVTLVTGRSSYVRFLYNIWAGWKGKKPK